MCESIAGFGYSSPLDALEKVLNVFNQQLVHSYNGPGKWNCIMYLLSDWKTETGQD